MHLHLTGIWGQSPYSLKINKYGDCPHILAEPWCVTDIFLLANSATPTRRRRASVSLTLRALALEHPRLLPPLHSYFFRGGNPKLNGGGAGAIPKNEDLWDDLGDDLYCRIRSSNFERICFIGCCVGVA